MYNYFNMSCLDDKSALRLNIKVNSENLLPHKYNIGSLRVPADPSWPKIPPRKLAHDNGDIIQPPCVITLTGTPRRSHTTVRTTQCQPFKTDEVKTFNSTYYLKTPPDDTTKRKPSCLDPRFKRVITDENQDIEFLKQHDNLKEQQQSMLVVEQSQFSNERRERNSAGNNSNIQQITPQEMKSKDEGSIHTNNSHFTQKFVDANKKTNVETNNRTLNSKQHIPDNSNIDNAMHINNTSKTNAINIKENVEPIFKKSKNSAGEEIPIKEEILTFISDEKIILEPINDSKLLSENQPLQSVNNTDEQILLVMENKLKSLPANKMQMKSISTVQYPTQCYSVQVPVITYQNVPLQISTCTSGEINVSPCIVNNTTTISDLCTTTQSKETHQILNTSSPLLEQDNLEQKKKILDTENMKVVDLQNVQKVLVLSKEKEDNISEHPTSKKNNYKTFSDNQNVFNCSNNYLNVTSGQNQPETNDIQSCVSTKVPEHNKSTFIQHSKIKSEENLLQTENIHTNKLLQPSESYNRYKRKRTRANFSKKAKSYFQKRCRSGIENSDCTLIWPGYQQVSSKDGSRFEKVRQYIKEKNCHNSMLKKPINEKHSNININCTAIVPEVKNLDNIFYQQKDESDYKCLQESNEDDPIRNPIRIPLKTQELLNKSYLEYYNKLRHDANNMENTQHLHEIALGTPKIKRKKSKQFYDTICNVETKLNPEIQTIEKCSALSSMINKNLNIRSSTDPIGGTQSKVIKKIASKIPADIYENSITSSIFISKIKHKRDKSLEKRFLRLKTIVFFGSMMYVLVVFLPMIYDYFFYEDYNNYENLTYIELIMDYVVSSFKEAFRGFFNTFYKIFFQPVRVNKKY